MQGAAAPPASDSELQRKFQLLPACSEGERLGQKNGKVNDEDGYARFGNMSDGSQTFRYQKVAIPAGTRLAFDYKFTTTGDVGNTFTIYAGEQVLVASEKISTWNSVTYESVDAVTISTMTTYINCVNSYGAGLSYTDLYRVGLSYRQ